MTNYPLPLLHHARPVAIMPFATVLAWVLLLFFTPSPVVATSQGDVAAYDPQGQFNQANFLFEQKQYPEALQIYLDIETAGFTSGPLLLNTGLTYMQLQQTGRAYFYFKRAIEYEQVQAEAERAIEFTEQQLQQQYSRTPVLAAFSWYEWAHFVMGYERPLLLMALLLNLAVLIWVTHWFVPGYRNLLRYSALLFLMGSLLAGLVGGYLYSEHDTWQRGMIVETGYELRVEPHDSAEVTLGIYPGFSLLLHKENSAAEPDWSFVHMSNGLEGWVQTRSLMQYP